MEAKHMLLNKSLFAFLVVSAMAVTTCKQSEFAGRNESAKKGAGNGTGANIQDSTAVASPSPSVTGLPTIYPSNPVVQGSPPPGGCATPAPGTIMNFESNPVGPFDSNTFWGTHGVRFLTSMRVLPTTRAGQPQPPKDGQAWQCIKCAGTPSRNRLMDATAEAQVGLHILASTIPANPNQSLDVALASTVSTGSFDLIDDDGSEGWSMILFDPSGQVLENRPLSTLKGYRPSSTGNGRPMTLTFARPQADVAGIRLVGYKSNGFFGFAFDNFNIQACPAVTTGK